MDNTFGLMILAGFITIVVALASPRLVRREYVGSHIQTQVVPSAFTVIGVVAGVALIFIAAIVAVNDPWFWVHLSSR